MMLCVAIEVAPGQLSLRVRAQEITTQQLNTHGYVQAPYIQLNTTHNDATEQKTMHLWRAI